MREVIERVKIEVPADLQGELRWMLQANSRPDPMGLYGPSVSSPGSCPKADRLCDLGFAQWRDPISRKLFRRGYWLTSKGREAVKAHPSKSIRGDRDE